MVARSGASARVVLGHGPGCQRQNYVRRQLIPRQNLSRSASPTLPGRRTDTADLLRPLPNRGESHSLAGEWTACHSRLPFSLAGARMARATNEMDCYLAGDFWQLTRFPPDSGMRPDHDKAYSLVHPRPGKPAQLTSGLGNRKQLAFQNGRLESVLESRKNPHIGCAGKKTRQTGCRPVGSFRTFGTAGVIPQGRGHWVCLEDTLRA